MHAAVRWLALGAASAVLGNTVVAWAQQPPAGGPPPGGGGMGRMGPGMGHGPGYGAGFADPAGYLDALKSDLDITPAQQPAWQAYADTVNGVAMQMQGAHQIMYDAMGTATWEERRDMMNRMFDARERAFATVHEAAQTLLPSLTPAQRKLAAYALPGMRGRGGGMMRGMAPPAAATAQ